MHQGFPQPRGICTAFAEIRMNLLRERYGDERFFSELNQGGGGDDGWGDTDAEWTAESFEAAIQATHHQRQLRREDRNARPAGRR